MNKNLLIVGVLVVLLVFSVVQAIQLSSIKSNAGELSTVKKTSSGIKSASTTSSGSSGAVPTNLQNLPGMVGGC